MSRLPYGIGAMVLTLGPLCYSTRPPTGQGVRGLGMATDPRSAHCPEARVQRRPRWWGVGLAPREALESAPNLARWPPAHARSYSY